MNGVARARRSLGAAIVVAVPLLGCGAAPEPADSADAESVVLAPPIDRAQPAIAAPRTPVAQPPVAVLPEVVAEAVPEAVADELGQPVVWPAGDVVFATPEEAAADFVRQVLIVEGEPALGEFRAGDARSGEIEVLFPGEGVGAEPSPRGLLLLRQLGPDDGWFVIAAASDGATISSPSAGATVAAGPLAVTGEARGFEGTVVVSAFAAGDRASELDSVLTRGGAFSDLEPFEVELDLAGAAAGDLVVVLVQGDVGLGDDPGDFTAIPVVIGDEIPPTR